MRRKEIRGLAVLVLLMAACLPSCNRMGKGKTIEVVLVTKALDSEWWQRVKAGADAAARANAGVKVTVVAPEREVNVDQQVAILEDQITKRVAALAVAPAGASEVIPVLDRARGAGIPVVIVDTDINWTPKLSYVGGDNQRAGRMAGEYMAKLLGVRVYTIGALTVSSTPDKDVPSDTVDAQLMRRIAEPTGGHFYSVSDENSLAEVYREIESLEKSRVGTREYTDYQEAHLAFLILGAALLFGEIALAATLFRRVP